MFDQPIAAFRVIPYFAQAKLSLPPLDSLLDISLSWLRQMEDSEAQDPEEDDGKEEATDDTPIEDD